MLLFLDTLFFNICIYISVLRKKASGKRKNNIVKELFSHNRYTHSSLGPDSARTLRQSSLYTSFPASSGISGTACARHCLYSILSKIGHCCCYEHYFFFFVVFRLYRTRNTQAFVTAPSFSVYLTSWSCASKLIPLLYKIKVVYKTTQLLFFFFFFF